MQHLMTSPSLRLQFYKMQAQVDHWRRNQVTLEEKIQKLEKVVRQQG